MKIFGVQHPYSCNPKNEDNPSRHKTFESWPIFIAAWEKEGANPDLHVHLNLIFRWDIMPKAALTGESIPNQWTLWLFIIGQRSGIYMSVQIDTVLPEDEESIIAYLRRHWIKHMEFWAPISTETITQGLNNVIDQLKTQIKPTEILDGKT